MVTKVDDPGYWDNKYIENNSNWDLKTPTPVFISLVENETFIRPSTLLIPGCGKGYDAVYAAEKGYKVTAVDFSEEAIKHAAAMAEEKGVNIDFLQEDIFNLQMNEKFDFIFEYVTYCAINPSRRREFARKMADLLKPGGRLIAIIFPIDGRPGGPPYSIDPIEAYRNFSSFLSLEFFSRDIPSVKPRKGKEVLHIYKKEEFILG
jgi:methyl halide transferase